jgi:hypothetical protein
MGRWRKLHDDELYDLYCSSRKVCRLLVGKPEGRDYWVGQDVSGCVTLG